MSDLKTRIDEIYRTADDWGHATNHLVEIEIGLSLTPAQRLRWLEEAQEVFLLKSDEKKPGHGVTS